MNKIYFLFALFFLIFPQKVFAASINLELIDQSDYYTVKVNISGLERTTCKSKTCYLQAMFTQKNTTPRYFGFTFGQQDWFQYQSKPEPDFIKSNFIPLDAGPDGNWSGIVRASVDKDDSDYHGSGEYEIKVKRYTGESTSAATDDTTPISITISDTAYDEAHTVVETTQTPTPTPTSTSATTSTITPSSAPTSSSTPTPTSVSSKIVSLSEPEDTAINSLLSEVLGASTTSADINLFVTEITPTPTISSSDPSPTNYKYLSLTGLLIALVSGASLYFKNFRGKI